MRTVIWWGLALGLVAGCTSSRFSGYDWIVMFAPQALKMDPGLVLNPMWTYLLLTPVALLPGRFSFLAFSLINLLQIWLAIRLSGVNRFALLLSFPALWMFWYGQLDGFVMLGVALGIWAAVSKKPIMSGFSILLLLVKPHIGIPLAIAFLFWSKSWKTILVVLFIFLLSLLFWGIEWPFYWLNNLLNAGVPSRMIQKANIGLFPYGLVSWLGLFVPMPRKEKAMYIVCATFASLNYVGTYSLLILLVLQPPWWAFVLSAAPIALGQNGYWITALVSPLVILWLLLKNITFDKATGKSILITLEENFTAYRSRLFPWLIKKLN